MKRYIVQTFGCQMNVHDSRRMEEVLHGAGYLPAETASDADLILLNTCSVREKAEHKLMSALGTLRPLKSIRKDLVLGVAGCVAQQEGERLLKKVPYLDLVIGPDNINELPALVDHLGQGGPPIARTVFDNDAPTFLHARPRLTSREVTAFVTIMKGCDERCSFCIVPYTRGSERYRPADDIVREIQNLVSGGVREVTLLGQTVNSWYDPEYGRQGDSQFAALLRRVADEVPNLSRLRYTSPHPRHVTEELVCAHANLAVLPHHVHLPVQSGSDRVLKRMIRKYTREKYIHACRSLQAAHPDMTLSTDIIVGFPGESDADFNETLSLVEEVGFVAAFAFKYSPRPYTPALKLGDDVPEEVKDARLSELLALVAKQQSAHLNSLVGSQQQVLIEDRNRDERTRFTGRTFRNEIVHVDVQEGSNPVGELLDVTVTHAYKHSLLGHAQGVEPGQPRIRKRPKLSLSVHTQ